MKRILLVTVLSLFLASCTTTVSLNLKNPTDIAQSPRVVVQNDKGVEKETLNLGKLKAKGQLHQDFKVPHSSTVVIRSSNDSGYDVCDLPGQTIPANPDPYPMSVDLCITGNYLPSDSQAMNAIKNALSDLGPNVGFMPVSVRNGLSTWFGALAAIVPASNDHPQKLLYLVQPARFAKKAITFDEFQYPLTVSSKEVQVAGKSSASLSASVPLYGSVGVDTASENLYNLKWSMNGFGAVTKQDAADWSLIDAITSLSDGEKELLYDALNKDKEAILLYINRFYVIKNADFYVKEGKKLATTAKLTASTFLTANGAWSFDSVTEAHQQFQDLVLNVGGITVPATVLRVESKAPQIIAAGKSRPDWNMSTKPLEKYGISGSIAEKPSPDGNMSTYIYQVAADATKAKEEIVLSGVLQTQQKNMKDK